jgi:S-adenosylmethionine:tRNA ribosyltransferase-isomerase
MTFSSRLPTSDFAFRLPPELIATQPAAIRSHSRLMVLHRETQTIEHVAFHDLPRFLQPSDLLVLNNSKVLPAQLLTQDGKFEALFLNESSPNHWVTLLKPGRKAPPGTLLSFRSKTGQVAEAEVLKTLEDGSRVLRFFHPFRLADFGSMPLPPYILKQRGEKLARPEDDERYQTVYAHDPGSVAAPTAGLHFTPELLAALPHAFITLHVGLGTFRPVKTEFVADHDMHREEFFLPPGLEEKIQAASRTVAVGTTAARVLESVSHLGPQHGSTAIFIHPPYRFRRVGALITNFHLPQSTLLMLVCAFAGTDFVMRAYREAVEKQYRFYSYGDAMLVL